MDRERLIKELEVTFYAPYKPGAVISNLTIEGVADFILADRRRICGPLIEEKNGWSKEAWAWEIKHKHASIIAINETLNLAGLSEEDK